MTDILFGLAILAVSIPIHEFGHWLGFRLSGYDPKIEFKWNGTIEIGKDVRYFMTEGQTYFMLLMGIWLGLCPIVVVGDNMLLLVYLLMCSLDISQLFIFNYRSKKTIIQFIRDSSKESEKEYREVKKRLGK